MDNLKDKVIIVLADGSETNMEEWQKSRGLGGWHIGTFFSIAEPIFQKNISNYGKLVVNAWLIKLLDKYRELKGIPVKLNSFNRSEERQKELINEGVRAAKTSPHVVFMAADIDTETQKETIESVAILKRAAKLIGAKVRIGHKKYMKEGKTFIHVDVCPEYYAPGKPFHKKEHPDVWEKSIEW